MVPPACRVDEFQAIVNNVAQGFTTVSGAIIGILAALAAVFIVARGGSMILAKISGKAESSGTDLAVADDRADYYNDSHYETVHDDYIDVRDYRRVRDDD
ncbi:hypothetical protein AYM39_21390 [Methylomonas sp. DH-1]|nr:hypothetical protein AYM39_21390 [Methylomonas sp. DH-1]